MSDTIKHWVDLISISTVIGTLVGWLPAIAVLLSIIWTFMRIVQGWPKFIAVVKTWFN